MIQLSPLPSVISHAPARTAAAGPGALAEFALPEAALGAEALDISDRQILAAPGKMPPAHDDTDEEDTGDTDDIAFAWFALPVAPPARAAPVGGAARPVSAAPKGATDLASTLPIVRNDTGAEIAKPESDAVPTAEFDLAQAPEASAPIKTPVPATTIYSAPARDDPVATVLTSQVAVTLLVAATPTTRRALLQDILPAGAPVLLAEGVRPSAIAAAAEVQQAALDIRRQEWMGHMVEHIEALRDASPTRETRLSLTPEALGKVDVSIRQDGDRIHVHFATETQTARQLIADAQPRLGELAEARGLKLGQTSFESGTADQGANRESREQLAPPHARKPRSMNPETVGAVDDDRIA